MAKLITPLNRRFGTVTSGERRFAERLKTHLEDDYLCWYDVPIGPKRLQPDFIILHPKRGLLVLEVKDWKLETIRHVDHHRVKLLIDGVRITTDANPLAKARQYAHAVVDRLALDPQLQNRDTRYQGRLCFPYGYGIVLSNITRSEFTQLFSEPEAESVLPDRLVICKDEMAESVDAMEFQARLWGMFQYQFGEPLTLPQIERVRWHLFPEVRINAIQRELFSRNEEPAPQEMQIPDIVQVMDLQQEQLARSLGSGHRVIHGVAGSGKTLILGYRCLHLAETAQKPILVLCFNITLAAHLSAFTAARGIGDKVHVYHFHAWCKAQLQAYHVEVPDGDGDIWDRQVEAVIAAVEDGIIPRAQYEAVMIDEGHDFAPEWLKLVVQMIDPASDSLLLLYDDAQSIYRKTGALKFSLSSVGIRAPGRTTILRLNYRNSREILQFAYEFARTFIAPASADDDHIPLIEPQSAGASGPRPAFRRHENVDAEIDCAVRCIRKWQAAGDNLSDIAIISTNKFHAASVQKRLAREKIAHLCMSSRRRKAVYDPAADQVSILSAHSSKGLEFKSVILIGVGHLTAELEDADRAKLLYVGMTRARQRLILTASRDNGITHRLSKIAA